MKSLLSFASFAAAISALACSPALAASLEITANGNIWSIYLNGALASGSSPLNLNGQFDTIDFLLTPKPSTTLVGANSGLSAGVPRPPGDPFTYINRKLNGDPLDDPTNEGWSILGLTNNASQLSWAGGPLGQKIDTSSESLGRLFLANVNFSTFTIPGDANGRVQLINAGNIVAELPIPYPEPATLGMGSLALLGLVALRRRNLGPKIVA